MYFTVFVTDKPGVTQTRSDLRDGFRAFLRNHPDHPDVVVHHGGATRAADGDAIVGLLLVVEAPSLDAVQAFVSGSPFGKADIFGEVQVRVWEWETGRPG